VLGGEPEAVMQTPSPWATKADVEAPYVNLATMHADLRAVQAVLTELRDRRPWWRRLFTAGAMIAAVVAVSAEAQADFKTGNQLYADCTSEEGASARVYCSGYIAAIADAAAWGPPWGVFGYIQCPRDTVTLGQMSDVVVRFLAAHPERRALGAAGLVAQALSEAFPCSK
jgi:hypothetical protein